LAATWAGELVRIFRQNGALQTERRTVGSRAFGTPVVRPLPGGGGIVEVPSLCKQSAQLVLTRADHSAAIDELLAQSLPTPLFAEGSVTSSQQELVNGVLDGFQVALSMPPAPPASEQTPPEDLDEASDEDSTTGSDTDAADDALDPAGGPTHVSNAAADAVAQGGACSSLPGASGSPLTLLGILAAFAALARRTTRRRQL
jgi:hypothetical protein